MAPTTIMANRIPPSILSTCMGCTSLGQDTQRRAVGVYREWWSLGCYVLERPRGVLAGGSVRSAAPTALEGVFVLESQPLRVGLRSAAPLALGSAEYHKRGSAQELNRRGTKSSKERSRRSQRARDPPLHFGSIRKARRRLSRGLRRGHFRGLCGVPRSGRARREP
jgi:hypothetical protein